MSSLFKASLTVGSWTLASRVLGFMRDLLTAAFLGSGPAADAFFVALKLPNFFRRITAEGAFSAAFVPQYTKIRSTQGDKAATETANHAATIMVSSLGIFTLIAFAFMPVIISVIAPGFGTGYEDSRYAWAIEMARITFPYLTCMSLAALMGGILNAHDRFAPFAAAPVFFNLCLIGALLGLRATAKTPGHALAWGVLIAGIVQLLWLWWHLRRNQIALKFCRPRLSPEIRKIFRLMGPGVIGAGIVQINIFIDMVLASLLPIGAVSYLYYADRFNQLPLGVIGIAIGTALLPKLSRALQDPARHQDAQALFTSAIQTSAFFTLPAATALFLIPDALIATLFERGEFTGATTSATAKTLAAYAMGLPAYIAIKIFSTVFYAHEDTKTPVRIAILGGAINIVLGISLIWSLGHVGIALATAIAAWLQAALLIRASIRSDKTIQLSSTLLKRVGKIALCCLVMGGVLIVSEFYLWQQDMSQIARIYRLSAVVSSGGIVYLVFAYLMKLTPSLRQRV